MLARLFVIFGGLLVLALLAVLVVPYVVDWSNYRADFEREASEVLGRPVTVKGKASARILPFPSVTFTDVSVAGAHGQPAMTVDKFSMDAELAPLLHGEFLIFDMRLVRPRAVIEIGQDGSVDWAVRSTTHFDPSRISVENLSISNGEIVLRHGASGREHRLTQIAAKLSARTLAGPWKASGSLLADGNRVDVSAATGAAADGAVRLTLDLKPAGFAMRVATEGNVRLRDGVAEYAGTVHAANEQLKPVEGTAAGAQSNAGYRLDGSFSLDHRRLALSDLRFETGPRDKPYGATGNASLDLGASPRFAVQASGDQIRFDEAVSGESAGAPMSFGERLAALEDVIRRLPRPAIPGTIDIDLPALVAGDTTVRDVRLSAQPAAGGWQIASLAATLPGRATLEAKGLLATGGDFSFDGALLVAVAQPSGFAAWLARDVDEAVRRLPAAGFNAKVKLSAARQEFDALEVILGDARLRGSVVVSNPGQGRPLLDVDLSGGRLDLDQLNVFASIFVGENGRSRFAGRDVNLALKAGPAIAGGFAVQSVDAKIELGDDRLTVDRLALNGLAGAKIAVSGSVAALGSEPTGVVDATVEAADLQPLLAEIAGRFPGNAVLGALAERGKAFPGMLGRSRFTLSAKAEHAAGDARSLRLSANGKAGGMDLSLSLSGEGSTADLPGMEISLEASARAGDPASLLALAGFHVTPLDKLGAAQLMVTMRGAPERALQAKAALTAEGFAARFDGAVAPLAGGIALKGPVTLEAEDIEPWMRTVGAGLPGFGLGTPVELHADADYADSLLVLSGLHGVVDEGAVDGDLNVALKRGKPEITGALRLDEFDLVRAAAVVVGEAAFEQGEGGALTKPFREQPASPFTAILDLSVGALDAGALGTLDDADFALTLDAGRVAVGGLTAKFAGGALKGNAELKNTAGTGLLSTQLDLRGAHVSTELANARVLAAGDFSASLSANGKSIGGLFAALGGSGSATMRDVEVAGINPNALPTLLKQADAVGRQVDAADVSRFAPAVVADGVFRARRADFAFAVAGGVVRVPPLTLVGAGGTLVADLHADLDAGTLNARGSVAYAPGADALVGSDPTVGFALDGSPRTAKLAFDMAPLAQYLTQRALEKEQARVEALQASLLEKQRLRRESRYYRWLDGDRERRAEEGDRRTEAAQIRVQDRAVVEADAARQAAKEAARSKVEEAMRLAETERARKSAEKAAAKRPPAAEGLPSVSLPAKGLNIDMLQRQLEETQ